MPESHSGLRPAGAHVPYGPDGGAGIEKHSLKVLLYAPAAGYLLVLAIHFLLDKAGLFQWIEHATNAPAEQSIVSVLRHSSDIPLITVICFSAAIAAPLVEELISAVICTRS